MQHRRSSRRQPWPLPCSWSLVLIFVMFPSPSLKPIRDQFEKGKSIRPWDFPIDSQHPIWFVLSTPYQFALLLISHWAAWHQPLSLCLFIYPHHKFCLVCGSKETLTLLFGLGPLQFQFICKCSTQMTFRGAVSMNCTKLISRQYLCVLDDQMSALTVVF